MGYGTIQKVMSATAATVVGVIENVPSVVFESVSHENQSRTVSNSKCPCKTVKLSWTDSHRGS